MKRTRRIPSTAPGRPKQVGEQRPHLDRFVAGLAGGELQVTSIAVHVLAEQGDFGDPRGSELLDLGDDVIERPGDLDAPDGRDDAEGATVVAADLDRDPGVEGRLADRRQRRREHHVVVEHGGIEDLGDRPAGAGGAEQVGGPMHVVGAHHDVDVGSLLPDELAVLLRQASRDHDLPVVALRLPGLELAEIAVEPVVGVLPDATRVEHDDVGIGRRRARARARRPRAGRRCVPSRARSSGTRRCARRSSGPSRSRRSRLRRTQVRTRRPSTTGATGELAAMCSMVISRSPSPGWSTSSPLASTV